MPVSDYQSSSAVAPMPDQQGSSSLTLSAPYAVSRPSSLYLRSLHSSFVVSFMLTACLTLLCSRLYSRQTPPALVMPNRPTVMFTGSSVFRIPLVRIERPATYASCTDRILRLSVAEKCLLSTLPANSSIYSISITGEQIGQTADLIDEYFNGEHKPALVVLGIAPVTIIDQNPAAIEPKRTALSRGFSRLTNSIFSWHRPVVEQFQRKVYHLYNRCHLRESGAAEWQRVSKASRWFDTCPISQQKLTHLKEIESLCDARGISLLVVSTPLDKEALDSMKHLTYQRYREIIKSTFSPHIKLLDLGESIAFSHDDFNDLIHLNAQGGIKMLKILAPEMRQALTQKRNGVDSQRDFGHNQRSVEQLVRTK